MVFRVAADQQPQEANAPRGPLARIDSSGADGARGSDGSHGSAGHSGGGRGGRGGDAGPAAAGGAAGAIIVQLESEPSADRFHAKLSGCVLRGGSQSSDVFAPIDFSAPGEIELVANGGAGGDGGRGGRGGDGGVGSAGRDATRFTSGDSGGPGGDGGNGGNGTSGARGGDGGAITVRVRERDTHLLLLLTRQTFAGDGGRAGSNGEGGSGGHGGSGGSSYSWTETETYTDSQGQSQTRTTHHSNSGGSAGPPGAPGFLGSAVLYHGAAGKPGSFAIEVEREDGRVTSYPDRYELNVVGFQHDNDNRDGVYEPDENVIVSRIAVKNVGPMPTPAHHDVMIGVIEQGWVDADEQQLLTLPRSLAPGETHVFNDRSLTLKLQGHAPATPGEALAAAETIHLFCAMPAANRRFGAFESTLDAKTGQIVVQFPAEISEVESLFSLAQGQATRVRFRLSNIALAALGRGSPGGRELALRWRLTGGELVDGEVITVDRDAKRARLDVGWHHVVHNIEARSSQDFELVIAVAPDARPYTSARFTLAAELAYLDDPRNARPVHLRDLVIRVGTPFSRQGADVLLVVNNRTDREELSAWKQLCDELTLTHTIWDVSLEGGVDVLGADARFSLAVVLDYAMDGAAGENHASELVNNERAHALASRCAALYVGERDVTRGHLIEATSATRAEEPVYRWYLWPWSEPKRKELIAVAEEQRARAVAERPDERTVVVHRFAPEQTEKTLWLRKFKLGTLSTARALSPSRATVSELTVPELSAHSPMTVSEDATLAGVLDALPFDKKLEILKSCAIPFGQRTLTVDGGVGDVVVASVVSDLLYELCSASAAGWKSGVRSKELRAKLSLLTALEESQREGVVAIESDEAKRLIELCAWLELLASECSRWWEWLPGAWGFRRGPALRAMLRAVRSAITERRTDSDRSQAAMSEAIQKRRAEIEQRWKALRDEARVEREGLALIRDRLDQRFGQRKRRDARDLLAPDERVMKGSKLDEMAQREEARTKDAHAFVTLAREAKGTLLCEETFEAISARAESVRSEEVRAFAEGATDGVASEREGRA